LDVLLETRTWSKPYLSNPFPYLFLDVTQVTPSELSNCKQAFLQQYQKYSQFKHRELPQLPPSHELPLLTRQAREELMRSSEELAKGPRLAHLSSSMDLKMERGLF
jgi:hypothetical protein